METAFPSLKGPLFNAVHSRELWTEDLDTEVLYPLF